MYAETSEKKMSHSRVAFALLCGLAVCCSVMYITADGNEYIHEVVSVPSAKDVDAGTSVGSTDVLKAGQIYTETPDGRMRLMDYFNNVEKEIAEEVANRKADIQSVRAQMARDFAFNAASRAKLKKNMLHRMAINAKIARDDLNAAMRRCHERFAKQARLANRRYRATLRRDRRTAKYIARDKREAARNLKLTVTQWTKTTNAWSAATNARIDKVNAHVSANAAQIKENAKKARKDLDNAMSEWDSKVRHFSASSKNARTKLGAEFAAQDKATRAWASNKIKGLVAETAAQFDDVETKMAKNRHEIDMALRQATARFSAALNAEQALRSKQYSQTVANIQAAKEEAAAKVNAASSEFKVSLLALGSTVTEQVAKVNKRIDDTAGVVRSNAAAQAKVNANVNAEMTRMIKLGNERYKHHLKGDIELQNLIGKEKAATDRKLNKMANTFNQALAKVRKELKRDRKHAEDQLKEQTAAVYSALAKNEAAQAKKNAAMLAETRRVKLDAMNAIRDAKKAFQEKIKALTGVVHKNDVAADAKIKKLTGVVVANAAKSAAGRKAIRTLEEANKKELKGAIADAIAKGEKRAQLVEERGEKMDKDTKFLINNRLNGEITKLREETNASVEKLALMNKEARAEMKKEMLYAIRSAAKVAKDDLAIAVKDAADNMVAFEKKASKQHTNNALARASLKREVAKNAREISRMIKDAVSTDARAQNALQEETATSIKKTNRRIDAYATRMKKIAKKTREDLKAQADKTLAAIKEENKRAKAAVKEFSSEDAKRQKSALDFLEKEVATAEKEADQKFGKAYERLSKDRAHADNALADAVKGLNDNLAKQAALADSRFSKTVKDISKAREDAAKDVSDMRKDFGVRLVAVTATVKNIEQNLVDEIAKVSAESISFRANQIRVNRRVDKELARVEELANTRFSDSKRARGQLRRLMDENKEAAAQEVKKLAGELKGKLGKARSKNAANKREMAKDLTKATEAFYEKQAAQQKADIAASEALDAATAAAQVASANALAAAKKNFNSQIVTLTNQVVANEKKAAAGIAKITGVVHNYAKASAKDRDLIKEETKALEKDLNKSVQRAISLGEARAKAVEQRIAAHLKNTKRYLQTELNERVERAADEVYKTLEGKRQKIADNYLSLKAYAVASADTVDDAISKGKGRALSSIGDLLQTVALGGDHHAKAATGVGMGGTKLAEVFSGKEIKVSGAVAAINGLCNEYSKAVAQVRNRWQRGLGLYLLQKLEESMMGKGVLQVDKIDGKSGNFVFMNGRSIGLSNKMAEFSRLAARMTTYESVLAKMTAKITSAPESKKRQKFFAKPPEWDGN
jgi:hypothetical protein